MHAWIGWRGVWSRPWSCGSATFDGKPGPSNHGRTAEREADIQDDLLFLYRHDIIMKGRLPESSLVYTDTIVRYVMKHMAPHGGGDTSHHVWISDLKGPVRSAIRHIKWTVHDLLLPHFPTGYRLISALRSDEIYLSVSPDKRQASDIIVSDCHYDTPFGPFQRLLGGHRFIRVLVACTPNQTVSTRIGSNVTVIDLLDFETLDYNMDLHCVDGNIPPGKNRILLKLHFLLRDPETPAWRASLLMDLCNEWTRVSREWLRATTLDSSLIASTSPFQKPRRGRRSTHPWQTTRDHRAVPSRRPHRSCGETDDVTPWGQCNASKTPMDRRSCDLTCLGP